METVLIVLLVLYFTGNLASQRDVPVSRISRAQRRQERRRQDERIAYAFWASRSPSEIAAAATEAAATAAVIKSRIKSQRFIAIMMCLPLIVLIASGVAQLFGLIR